MDAKELRIGNYIMIDNELLPEVRKDVCIVSGIQQRKDKYFPLSDSVISVSRLNSWVTYNQFNEFINPIPLTEEWFKRFHTEDQIEKSVRFPNEITIYDRFLFIWKPEYKYWYVVTAYHKEYLTKIEFVHEYQNFILG